MGSAVVQTSTLGVLALSAALGCSLLAPSDDELLGGPGGAAAAGGVSAGGSGGNGAAGGTGGATGGTGGATGGMGGVDGGADASAGAGGSGGASCTPGATAAVKKPVGLYVILDRTSSMFQAGRYAFSSQGIADFMQLPAAAGTQLATQTTPPLSGQQSCAGAGYSSPAVAMGALPGHASAISAALASAAQAINAQMEGVLNGGTQYAKAHAAASSEQASLVLITDWNAQSTEPCDKTPQVLGGIAAAAMSTDPYVLTWVIAMDPNSRNALLSVGTSGQTGTPIIATGSAAVRDRLTLASARCRLERPADTTGGQYQLARTAPNGKAFTQLAGLSACTNNSEEHWYLAPDALVLCPAACVESGPTDAYQITTTCN